MTGQTRLYHATSLDRAASIVRTGFKDGRLGQIEGVWFTSHPAGEADGLDAVAIAVDVPQHVADLIREVTLTGDSVYYGALKAETVNGFHREAIKP